ncbi:hypothetical protein BC833DRAFT_592844 [Globomyces pollinis-pini]|nr:hypothetical protein BC833DRAFT_592844 [Globomyces pollinis-pini]
MTTDDIVECYLNLRIGRFGQTLRRRNGLNPLKPIIVSPKDTFQSLLQQVRDALPPQFDWDEHSQPIRYQRTQSQPQSSLEEVPESFFHTFKGIKLSYLQRAPMNPFVLQLWIYGEFKGSHVQNLSHSISSQDGKSPTLLTSASKPYGDVPRTMWPKDDCQSESQSEITDEYRHPPKYPDPFRNSQQNQNENKLLPIHSILDGFKTKPNSFPLHSQPFENGDHKRSSTLPPIHIAPINPPSERRPSNETETVKEEHRTLNSFNTMVSQLELNNVVHSKPSLSQLAVASTMTLSNMNNISPNSNESQSISRTTVYDRSSFSIPQSPANDGTTNSQTRSKRSGSFSENTTQHKRFLYTPVSCTSPDPDPDYHQAQLNYERHSKFDQEHLQMAREKEKREIERQQVTMQILNAEAEKARYRAAVEYHKAKKELLALGMLEDEVVRILKDGVPDTL